MKMKLFLSAALAASALAVFSAAAATSSPVVVTNVPGTNASPADAMKALFGDPVVVQAKNFEIRQSELDQVMTGLKARAAAAGQPVPPEVSAGVLEQLISIQVLLQKATEADRKAGLAESELQFSNLIKSAESPEAFQRQIKAIGMTEKELRERGAQEAAANIVRKRELGIKVTDEEVKAFYEKHSAAFEQPEMARARHILLMTMDPETGMPLATNAIADKRKQAEDLLKQIRGGGDFAALAKQYSEDPDSKIKGGELPEFARGQTRMPEFEAAAFALTNNQVSDIITTQYGFHIIQLLGKTPAKQFGFNDTLPQVNKTVAEVCRAAIENQKSRSLEPALMARLRAEQNVVIVDPTLKALTERLDQMRAKMGAGEADEDAPAAPAAAPAATNAPAK